MKLYRGISNSRKAQATLFIILGVLLILIVGVYVLTVPTLEKTEIKKGFDDINIDNVVTGCIEAEAEKAIYLMGYQAGYVNIPDTVDTIDIFVSKVPYWLNDHVLTLPNEFIESELSYYLDSAVLKCINDSNKEYDIEFSQVDSDVVLYDDLIHVTMDVGILVKRGQVERKTGVFSIMKDVRAGMILDKARAIVKDLQDGKKDLSLYTESDGLVIFSYDQGDNNYVYTIFDNSSRVQSNPYQFYFSVKIPEADNPPPQIDRMPPLKVRVGERVYLDYNAEDDMPKYQLEFGLTSFNIPEIDKSTGIIDFTPMKPGLYQALVTVVDGFGQKDYDTLIIEVES